MIIRKVIVKNAGPIADCTFEFDKVNLIIGNNEDGKTTLIDILIQHLFPKPQKKSIVSPILTNRFNGQLNVKIEANELPVNGDNNLLNLVSLFVIREGETRLRGYKNKDGDLQNTDLWNVEIKEIIYGNDGIYTKLKDNLSEVLGISKQNSWLKAFDSEINNYRGILIKLADRVEQMKSRHSERSLLRKDLANIEQELDNQTQARKYFSILQRIKLGEKYFQLIDEKKEIEEKIENLEKKSLEHVRKEWENLRNRYTELKNKEVQTEQLLSDNQKMTEYYNRQIESLNQQLKIKDRQAKDLEHQRKEKLEEKEKAEQEFQANAQKIQKQEKRPQFSIIFKIVMLILSLLGLTSLILPFLPISLPLQLDKYFMYILASVFIPSSLLLMAIWLISLLRYRNALLRQKVLRDKLELFIDGVKNEIKHIDDALGQYNSDIQRTEQELEELNRRKMTVEIKKIQAELDNTKQEIERIFERETEFKKLYYSYENVVAEQEQINQLKISVDNKVKELEACKTELEKEFKTTSPSRINELLIELQKELKINKPSGGQEYNEEEFDNLMKKKTTLQEKIASLSSDIEKAKAEVMTESENAFSGIIGSSKQEYVNLFYPGIQRLKINNDVYNLPALIPKLDKFIERVEKDIHLSHLVKKAFDNVNSRVDHLLREVLQDEVFIHALQKLTNGNYIGADFTLIDNKKLEIVLLSRTNTRFPFQGLSTGTRNQFYFAVRLALAMKRFSERPAVFILDDAFLSFDGARRRSALELLKEYTSQGWQVIYSTVNDGAMEQVFDEVFGEELNKIRL